MDEVNSCYFVTIPCAVIVFIGMNYYRNNIVKCISFEIYVKIDILIKNDILIKKYGFEASKIKGDYVFIKQRE